jgi:nitroreductase
MELKQPKTENKISGLITERWSARSFKNEALTELEINTLLEAASWAASSMNEQPWHYLVAENGSEAFDNMIDCLMGGNQPWAKNAPLMLVSLTKKNFDRNNTENRHAMHDAGAANTTLLLQAAELDIFGHMMGGFHYDKTLEIFQIDGNEFEIACFIALGHLDIPEALEEPFKSRETAVRTRKTISEISSRLK